MTPLAYFRPRSFTLQMTFSDGRHQRRRCESNLPHGLRYRWPRNLLIIRSQLWLYVVVDRPNTSCPNDCVTLQSKT